MKQSKTGVLTSVSGLTYKELGNHHTYFHKKKAKKAKSSTLLGPTES